MTVAMTRQAGPAPGYELVRVLGRGGYSEVWEATAPDGSPVALKYLPCRHKSAGVIANEIRQLLSLRELRHPHLIQVHSIFAGNDVIIISMERADGSLTDLFDAYVDETGAPIPADHLCDLLDQAAVALDFLASRRASDVGFAAAGLQHCDIKPTNLLLFGDCLKVADFGLCTQRHLNTVRNYFSGTPPYTAPEVYQGRISNQTDQYALAVTYCQMRGGKLPFVVTDRNSCQHQAAPPDLSRIPAAERPVILRALDAKASNRWPSCQAFMRALRQAAQAVPGAVCGGPPPAEHSRPASRGRVSTRAPLR